MEDWQCGVCSKAEGGEDKVLVNKLSPLWLLVWKLSNILPINIDIDIDKLFGGEGKEENVKIEARCHHCGKPLCQKHRILVADDAFSINENQIKTLLPSWWPKNVSLKANKNFRALEQKALLLLKKYHSEGKKLKQRAYHCQDCWQEYHPSIIPENE
jgi:hypothetical protein